MFLSLDFLKNSYQMIFFGQKFPIDPIISIFEQLFQLILGFNWCLELMYVTN